MNLLEGLKKATNYTFTENGAVTHKSTLHPVLDMFAMGGSYRNRNDYEIEQMFEKAYKADPTLALKCLFYLRDCRGGQGERRFFRVCFRHLLEMGEYEAATRNLPYISEYGRYDDILAIYADTLVENVGFEYIKLILNVDMESKTPSLLAKWLPSENASSYETKRLARKLAAYLGYTHKQYRQVLSMLRAKIKIVERLMSEGRWDEIEFDKIPSRAGLIYKNAFARRDIIAEKYEVFARDTNTKVNADVLNPVDIAHKALNQWDITDIDRAMLDKYWINLKDYYNGRVENGLCVVDVSGSMSGFPMEAAISMGTYIAERGYGPFANHFITFSRNPQLVEITSGDIVNKFRYMIEADWGGNTDIQKVFDLMLNTAKKNNISQADMPERLYIFSDMEFDSGFGMYNATEGEVNTLFENIAVQWKKEGYELPHVIFWNLDCRQDNIPALDGRFSYVSGQSMSTIEAILSGKTGFDLMMEVLMSKRYEAIV